MSNIDEEANIARNVEASAKIIRSHLKKLFREFNKHARDAVMLGSGLDPVANIVKVETEIDYTDLPGFPKPTVEGHAGKLVIGTIQGRPVVFLRGRQHGYEGEGFDGLKVIIRTMKALGIKNLFLTNAVGSINPNFPKGSMVAIRDHVNLGNPGPLIGVNDDSVGPRFPDQGEAWNRRLLAHLHKASRKAGVKIGEGVYLWKMGPEFETPAEIQLFAGWGNIDTIGMSTVPENILGNHCDMDVVGLSAVVNLAAGLSNEKLSQAHTIKGSEAVAEDMAKIVQTFILRK